MEGRTPVPELEKIEEWARHKSTMVIFLSMGLLKQLEEKLMEGGYDKDTPAAIVYKATWPEEKKIICTVGTMVAEAEKNAIKKTAIILVGDVINSINWKKSRLYAADFETEYRKARRPVNTEEK